MRYKKYEKFEKMNAIYTTYENNYSKNNAKLKEEFLKLNKIILKYTKIKRNKIKIYKVALEHKDKIIDIDKLAIGDFNKIKIDNNTTLYEAKEDADALITRNDNNILVMAVADCMCIYIVDEIKGVYSLVHSGWKSTLLNILPKTLEKMNKEYDCNYKDIKLIISPHILKKSFEISDDVIDRFENYIEAENITREKAIEKKENGKYNVDLDLLILNSIKKYNIPECNIYVSEEDTLSLKDENGNYMYHSYRRDKNNSGRNLGVLFI